ncbi:MAG: caspase family protein [Gammaproteobacteria bacterium]|nr:caspase family protein [Gammaproteobacteria bacterium]MCF6362877.1 caspase family protein [Gammaproteobacteria bacterium]
MRNIRKNVQKYTAYAGFSLKSLQRGMMAFAVTLTVGCAAGLNGSDSALQLEGDAAKISPDKFLPVDCLLPPQVRKLGAQMTYLAARRPIKTTALNCEIRGGEYVAYDRADYRTALKTWLEPAKQGNAEAQTYVGEIYEKGLGLPADYKTAFTWYSRAAEQNFSRAQINLGYLYEKGLGVPRDMLKALNWYRLASGIQDDHLDYSSNIEIKASTLAQEQTEVLRQEIQRREQQVQDLSTSVADMEKQLQQRENTLQSARQQLAQLNDKITQDQEDATHLSELKAAYAAQQKRIAQTQAAVVALQSQMLQVRTQVTRQTGNLTTQRQMLAMQDIAGPSIEVFDPVIVVTRGSGPVVRVPPGNKVRSIKGRITAPAGLKRASINGESLAIDGEGIFQATVPVESKAEVSILATDKQDRTASFSFVMEPARHMVAQDNRISRIGVAAKGVNFGRYFALVIGNNDYSQFPTLETAVNDAQRVAAVLQSDYGFDTQLILNADRYAILSALNDLRGQLTEADNLLIYYAGHGERDPETLQGYWLPVDAEQANTANWIANSTISDLLNTFKAKHILVVADSCYSGSMTQSSVARIDTQLDDEHLKKWLKVMAKTPSRTVLTSGGVSPVLDGGGGEHSVFAKAFIQELEQDTGIIDAYKIYLGVSGQVKTQAASIGFIQRPTYAPIRHTGHNGGEFIFVKEREEG